MRALSLAILLLLTFPAAAADDFDPGRPLFAAAIRYDDSTIVSWNPSPEQADYFNVYGVRNGERFLLESVAYVTFAEVASGFQAYEVTAIHGDIESTPVTALTLSVTPPCRIDVDLPRVYVGCSKKTEFAFHLELVPSGLSVVQF